MKRYICIFLTLLLAVSVFPRKKVAVVLSGGGAKGMAHIGALKVINEAGIPIDYVVGTSMGAIVGGLYSIGYTPQQLDSAVSQQDWIFLLTDKVSPEKQTFWQRENSSRYQLSIPFTIGKNKRLGGGVITGDNLSNLFSEMTVGYHKNMNFNDLPVPFACVATNVVNGEAVVFHRGKLDLAMRASMAIPAVFTPVRMDSMVLVDGGMVNNFPVNVALAMGADYVIGIDVQSPLLDAKQLTGTKDILGQLIELTGQQLYEENKKKVTVYVHPDVDGFSTASFSTSAIDSLILNGERATRAKWDELIRLKGIIGVEESYMPPPHGPFAFSSTDDIKKTHKLSHPTSTDINNNQNTLNFGLRFDTEDIGALVINATAFFNQRINSKVSLTGRLSKNPFVQTNYAMMFTSNRNLNVGFKFSYNDIDVYQRGERKYNTTYRYYMGNMEYSDIFRQKFKLAAGIRYEFFDYESFLLHIGSHELDIRPHGFISYYLGMKYETYDRWYFPTRGMYLHLDYALYTDNMINYEGHVPFSAIGLSLGNVVRATDRFAILPSLYGRILSGHRVAYPYLNTIGGFSFGRYVPQQLPFAGVGPMEVLDNSAIILKLQLRQRLGAKNYISLIGNYGYQNKELFPLINGKSLWGGAVSYAYDSLFGPLEASLGFSTLTHHVKFYASLGYVF